MRAQLDIVWDGSAPGLAEHELSVSALNESLRLLLAAVRRIRSTMLTGASKQIDLRIKTLGHGCLSLGIEVVFPDEPTRDLFEAKRVEETMTELLDALDAESRGEQRNSAVRRYLLSLKGVTSQRYTARVEGKFIKDAEFGALALSPETDDHPYPREIVGEISGVLFPPSAPEVVLMPQEGKRLQLAATARQVEQALALRSAPVVVRVINRTHGKQRLLSLQAASERKPRPSPTEAGVFVLERWRDTLERLGR